MRDYFGAAVESLDGGIGVIRALPPGIASPVAYEAGWLTPQGTREPFLSYAGDANELSVNWSDRLEELHEQSSRDHFIDVWTRRAMLTRLGPLRAAPTVLDVGCSSGYLLADLRAQLLDATLIGVDLVAGGLCKAHKHVPDALLLQADVCDLPVRDACVDVVVSANLLEHVPDDLAALAEIRRVMSPGARAVLVVPVNPKNYDYYDHFLGHERRYRRGELAGKASAVGLRTRQDIHLGAPLYPAFWATKQRNRRRFSDLSGEAVERRVIRDMGSTLDSPVGRLACRLEEILLTRGVNLPFGIRGLTVLERPGERV